MTHWRDHCRARSEQAIPADEERGHLQEPLLFPIRTKHVDLIRASSCDLSCSFVDGNSIERRAFVKVYGLKKVVRATEDHQSIAGDVRLDSKQHISGPSLVLGDSKIPQGARPPIGQC